MNGRVYDPILGLFLSADPYIQSPSSALSTNRYSYVLNNPLSYTDPSGYFFKKIRNALKRGVSYLGSRINQAGAWIDDNKQMLATVAMTVALGPASAWYFAAMQGAILGYIQTGTLRGAVMGGVFAGVSYGIGSGLQALQSGTSIFATEAGNYALGVAAHGVSGGIRSVMQGGDFGVGFRTAAVTKGFSPVNGKMWPQDGEYAQRVVTAAIIGGTTSKYSGGKFENGAVTAAMIQAYNWESTSNTTYHGKDHNGNPYTCSRSGSVSTCTFSNGESVSGRVRQTAVGALAEESLGAQGNINDYHETTGAEASQMLGYAATLTIPMARLSSVVGLGGLGFGIADLMQSPNILSTQQFVMDVGTELVNTRAPSYMQYFNDAVNHSTDALLNSEAEDK